MSDPQKTCSNCGVVFTITHDTSNGWVWTELADNRIAYFCSDSCCEQYREGA